MNRLSSTVQVNGKAYHRAGILGRGGSSKVYRVIAAHNNEICALKKVDTRNDAESRASFINEITLLKKLSGKPEIIQLIDAEVQSRYVYMVSFSIFLSFGSFRTHTVLRRDRSWKLAIQISTASWRVTRDSS